MYDKVDWSYNREFGIFTIYTHNVSLTIPEKEIRKMASLLIKIDNVSINGEHNAVQC